MNALPSKPMKRRSPRVVGIGRKPRLSTGGETIPHTVKAAMSKAITMKKIAVGAVHTIHPKTESEA